MNEEFARALLEEIVTRQGLQFDITQFCFKEQIDFITDPAPFKTAVCSRRAGKTIACAADLISTALRNPRRVCLYITLSRNNAKKIIWGELLEINRVFKLEGKVNETDLSITFPNRSIIYASGAGDRTEIEKFRGLPITLCYIDEAQGFREYIKNLIDEVISKALFDYNGTLCLTGTPSPVPSGYFHDCAHSNSWSHHAWTMFQNPFLSLKSGKTPQELVERDLKMKGVTIDDPTIQRECFGRWVLDRNSLVFRYDRALNDYDEIPAVPGKWEYVVGVDLGFDDADAIAVVGWNEKIKECYLVEEIVKNKQGISDLAEQIGDVIRRYQPLKVVMDTGGLGKKIAEEIQTRYALPVEAAEKTRKLEFIELLNDALRTKRFRAKAKSRFAQDAMLVEFDRDKDDHSKSNKLKISDNYHSDICDAVLYAFREALHWLFEPEPVVPKFQTPEWFTREEERMLEAAENAARKNNSDDIWGDLGLDNS